jgi:hypothetical protein
MEAELARNPYAKARRPPTSTMSAFEVFQIRDAAVRANDLRRLCICVIEGNCAHMQKALHESPATQTEQSNIDTVHDEESNPFPLYGYFAVSAA